MQIAVVGLGLIGGSIALALKSVGHFIIGVETNPEFVAYAQKSKMVDSVSTLEELPKFSPEVTFICVSLENTRAVAEKVYEILGDSTIITDVASVKSVMNGICGRVVGGHPMAGTENSGIYASKEHLFENAFYVIVPYENTRQTDIDIVNELILQLKAKPIFMSESEHDERVSKISHLPHIISYALSSYALGCDGFVGSGFMDTTRISASSPEFWTKIALLNRKNLLNDAKNYREVFNEIISAIEKADEDKLYQMLLDGQTKRKKIAYERLYLSEYEFTVDLKDEVGSLLSVIERLTSAKVNISGIQIVNSREGVGGALKLSVKSERDYEKAKEIFSFDDRR